MNEMYDMYAKETAARKAGLERIAEVQQFLDALKADYKIERHHPEPSELYLRACAREYRKSLKRGQAALRGLGYVVLQFPEPAWVADQLAVVVDS